MTVMVGGALDSLIVLLWPVSLLLVSVLKCLEETVGQ